MTKRSSSLPAYSKYLKPFKFSFYNSQEMVFYFLNPQIGFNIYYFESESFCESFNVFNFIMENRNNADFLLNTLESFQKNITISIKETESKMELFDSQFKEITKPLTAIHKTLINLLKSFLDEFKHIQSKFESKSKFIKDFCLNNKSESLSMNLIKDESLLNIQVTKKQSKLIQEIEKINVGIEILKKISQLKEFKQFISLQDKDEDTFNEEEENASLDEESNSTVSNNAQNENSLLTKKTERDDVDSIIEKVRNKRTKNIL